MIRKGGSLPLIGETQIKKTKGKIEEVFFMAKLRLFSWIVCFSLPLFLSGCLDFERASISIDLANKIAEVRFFNIVSNSTEEETIREDFRFLIKQVYFDEDSKSDPDRIISRRLFKTNNQLDGVERFSFKDLRKALKDWSIEVDKSGAYILDITKEVENYRVSGNGQYLERGSKKFLKWPKNVKRIEVEEKSKEFDEAKKTSLLKHWLDWVDKNTKEERTQ
jgi:hypothetical protein